MSPRPPQDARVGRKGVGDADVLLLAARSLGRVLTGIVGEADEVEELGAARFAAVVRPTGDREQVGHVSRDGVRAE